MYNNFSSEIIDFLNDFSYEDDEEIQQLCGEVLSLKESVKIVEFGIQRMNDYRIISSSTLWSDKELLKNWDNANAFLYSSLQSEDQLDWDICCEFNKILVSNLHEIRSGEIFAGPWQYLESTYLDIVKKEFRDKILSRSNSLFKAFEVYIWLINIHPFKDGNGRTARICADYILLGNGFLPLCFDSSVSSFVANVLGGKKKSKKECIKKTLNALKRSYQIASGEVQ